MSYKGKFKPSYPEKYNGDPTNIIYRSLWERKFCVYCDTNERIIEWSSEEKCIPYRSPLDGKIHRYFPDFLIKVKESNGSIKKYIAEVYEYAKNQSKWEAAKEWCADRGYEFKIITEHELKIK